VSEGLIVYFSSSSNSGGKRILSCYLFYPKLYWIWVFNLLLVVLYSYFLQASINHSNHGKVCLPHPCYQTIKYYKAVASFKTRTLFLTVKLLFVVIKVFNSIDKGIQFNSITTG